MTRLEKVLWSLILGFLPPMILTLVGWAVLYFTRSLNWIGITTVSCIAAGLFFDFVYLRGRIRFVYEMPLWLAGFVYLFYTAGMYGFFMGVPTFQPFLTIPVAVFVAGRCHAMPHWCGGPEWAARRAALVTTGMLVLVCIASAWIALADPYTASNLEGMLALPFHLSGGMILGLILVGGAALLVFNWWLAVWAVRASYTALSASSPRA